MLDLTDVVYMGSSVLGLMVNVRQTIKSAGGKLVLCGMSERLHGRVPRVLHGTAVHDRAQAGTDASLPCLPRVR